MRSSQKSPKHMHVHSPQILWHKPHGIILEKQGTPNIPISNNFSREIYNNNHLTKLARGKAPKTREHP